MPSAPYDHDEIRALVATERRACGKPHMPRVATGIPVEPDPREHVVQAVIPARLQIRASAYFVA